MRPILIVIACLCVGVALVACASAFAQSCPAGGSCQAPHGLFQRHVRAAPTDIHGGGDHGHGDWHGGGFPIFIPPVVIPFVQPAPQPVIYPNGRYDWNGSKWVWTPAIVGPPPPPAVAKGVEVTFEATAIVEASPTRKRLFDGHIIRKLRHR
jgi:hypothetical protein